MVISEVEARIKPFYRCQFTSINNKELKYWFANYEIEINGEWQPFGAVEDCTGE